MKLKRLLALLGSLVVATSASASLVACGTISKQNEIKKPTLDSIVTTTDLGIFDHENVTNEEILTRVKEKNADLDLGQVVLNSTSVKVGKTYQIYLSVSPTATSYRQSDVTLSYEIVLPDQRVELTQTIKVFADLGNFNQTPSVTEILERIAKLNPQLTKQALQELQVEVKDETFEISVKDDSKVYFPTSLKGNFTIGQTKNFTELLGQKAQILMLASQFGLSQEALTKIFGLDTKTFADQFDVESLNNLAKDAKFHQPLGEQGAVISRFIGTSFKIANPIFQQILNSTLGAHLTGEDYSAAEIGKAISTIVETVLPFLSNTNLPQILRQGALMTDKIKLNEDQVKTLQTQVGGFVNGEINQKYILPIMEGIQAGTDLSRLQNLDFKGLIGALANNVINTLGYATQAIYEPIDDVATGSNVTKAAARLAKMVLDGDLKKFDFSLHTKEFIASAVNSLGILNHILSIVRTPNVEYTKDKDYSKNIFSTEKNNNEFISGIYETKLADIKDLDLNIFNVTELLSNLGYYLGGNEITSQYRLQKVLYVLLIGSSKKLSPIADLGYETAVKIAKKKINYDDMLWIERKSVDKAFGLAERKIPNLIYGLVNNDRLPLKEQIFDTLIWVIAGPAINIIKGNELGDKIRDAGIAIEKTLGNQSWGYLFNGELREVIKHLAPIIGEEKIANIINIVDTEIGKDRKLNINNLLQLPLNIYLKIFRVAGFTNLNLPTYESYYTSRTIPELFEEVQHLFGINGFEDLTTIKNKAIDLNKITSLATRLLSTKDGRLSLIEEAISKLGEPKEFLKVLGFTDLKNSIVLRDSALGQILEIFIPDVSKRTEEKINLLDYDLSRDIIFEVLSKLGPTISNLLVADNISNFVKIINDSKSMTISEKDYTFFDITNELKSGKIIVEFKPEVVHFKDGTTLSGEIQKMTFEFSRANSKDKFIFTKLS